MSSRICPLSPNANPGSCKNLGRFEGVAGNPGDTGQCIPQFFGSESTECGNPNIVCGKSSFVSPGDFHCQGSEGGGSDAGDSINPCCNPKSITPWMVPSTSCTYGICNDRATCYKMPTPICPKISGGSYCWGETLNAASSTETDRFNFSGREVFV